MLKYLEQIAHPRWPTPHDLTKRVVGVAVLILSLAVTFTPLPLSNIPPALAIALISLAYLEEDGLLLGVGLVFGARRGDDPGVCGVGGDRRYRAVDRDLAAF